VTLFYFPLTDLKPFNSFGISAIANEFIEIASFDQLKLLIQSQKLNNFLVLGGGSNILFTKDFDGLILKNQLLGISVLEENNETVLVKAAGGENWHNFVRHCVSNGWGGIENLSLIPGSVGAAPLQNIGAYGVEIKESLVSLEAINLLTGELKTFNNEQCQFGYRESIFKHQLKGQYFICSVTFKLNKNAVPNISYGDISKVLNEWNILQPDIADVSDAVIHIRTSKLPDPALIGNAGSFFKNPVIDLSKFLDLQKRFPDIKSFPAADGKIKIPAAWLIEQCGFKGKRFGNVGVHENQALVLVNYGGGTGKDILELSKRIIESVKEKFGIELQTEVNII
jgi:UDP-N-acetylmuramate dehydrogenase